MILSIIPKILVKVWSSLSAHVNYLVILDSYIYMFILSYSLIDLFFIDLFKFCKCLFCLKQLQEKQLSFASMFVNLHFVNRTYLLSPLHWTLGYWKQSCAIFPMLL